MAVNPVPPNGSDWMWVRKIADAVNLILRGKLNNTLDVTLNPSAATTTVKDPRIGSSCAFAPAMAMTAHAATAIAAGIWVSNLMNGSLTLNHANTADVDKTIRFTITG